MTSIHKALVFLVTLLVCAFAMQQADARIETDAALWSAEATSHDGIVAHVGSSDSAPPAIQAIAMLGLAIYIYRFRKLRKARL